MDPQLLSITILPLFLTFFLTAVFTPLSLILIKKIGLFDDPKVHKHPAILHKKPIPRGGGIPIILAILCVSPFFLPLNIITISLGIAAVLALIIGVLDDKL